MDVKRTVLQISNILKVVVYTSANTAAYRYFVKKQKNDDNVLPLRQWSEFSPKSTTTSTVYTIKLSFQVPTCNITLKTHRTT